MVSTTRGIASGETYDATGSDAATYENAGTVTTAGTTTAAASTTQAIDVDASTPTVTRARRLTVRDQRRTRTIQPGESHSVAAGETTESLTVENAGSLSNAGTYKTGDSVTPADGDTATISYTRIRVLSLAPARDVDASTPQLSRMRPLTAASADVDSSTAAAVRLRALGAAAASVDASPVVLRRQRALSVAASDRDAATTGLARLRALSVAASDRDAARADTFVIPVPEGEDAVTVTKTLLAGSSGGNWRGEKPTVRYYWGDSQSEKGPGAGQPPILYVRSPTSSSLERFSIDDSEYQRNDTVVVQVWSLREREPVRVQQDVVRFLSLYLDDNARRTPYSTVEPVSEDDFREQKNARSTDYYITAVEVETVGLSAADMA